MGIKRSSSVSGGAAHVPQPTVQDPVPAASCTHSPWPEAFSRKCARQAGSALGRPEVPVSRCLKEQPSASGGWALEERGPNFFAPQVGRLGGVLHAVCLKSPRRLGLSHPQRSA